MLYKIKVLGFALIAITALSVSAARAGEFDIGVQPAVIKGVDEVGQDHVLTVQQTDGGILGASCQNVSFEGTSVGQTINEATITPTYGSGCLFNGLSSQVRMNGCKFTVTGSGQASNTFLIDIVGCTSSQGITTQSFGCQYRIPEQNGLSHVVATNLGGSPSEVTLEATMTGMTGTQVGPACPDGSNHQAANTSVVGNTIMTAFEHEGTEQVTEHGHQHTRPVKGGEQVSISST